MLKKLIAATAFAAILAGGQAMAQDSIRIATEGAYKPWNFKDEGGNLVGFELDLAAELCKRMGMECQIVEQEWDGIIPALTGKRYDAIMAGMSITEERKQTISFSRSYANTPITFGVMEGSDLAGMTATVAAMTLDDLDAAETAQIEALKAALDGKTVGVQISTTHEAFMKEFLPDVALKSYDKMDNMLLDLEAGRIDAGYTEVPTLLEVAERGVVQVGPKMTGGLLGEGVGVGIRQEDAALAEKFSTAIDSMMADGSLAAMTEKWFGFDASPAQ
ncbi:MAG: transporter substrate-binding domain-containing protein [Pseudomonadota bacterium]